MYVVGLPPSHLFYCSHPYFFALRVAFKLKMAMTVSICMNLFSCRLSHLVVIERLCITSFWSWWMLAVCKLIHILKTTTFFLLCKGFICFNYWWNITSLYWSLVAVDEITISNCTTISFLSVIEYSIGLVTMVMSQHICSQ